jgi:voltage-gated potassium channel
LIGYPAYLYTAVAYILTSPYKKIRFPLLLISIMLTLGVAGYMLLEQYSFTDALYMTVITLSTVGFGEVNPLSSKGRIFTMVLIMFNIGTITYLITLMSQYIFDGAFLKDYKLYKMQKQLTKTSDHVIICGYGRNGKSAASALDVAGISYVIIDQNKDAISKSSSSTLFIHGDATKEDVLMEAEIKSARALITTMPEDANNVFTILTAKELNPGLLIISRASSDSSISKLKHAGATNVIMPDKIGGTQMAQLVNSPDLKEFIDNLSFQNKDDSGLKELVVGKPFRCDKAEILDKFNLLVLSYKNEENIFDFSHTPCLLKPGYRIIVLGKKIDIDRLDATLKPG